MLVPTVIETTNRGERAYDIYSRLLRERIVFLGTALDETVANLIIAQLLHLEGEDMDKPINLYINSPGGDMVALFAVYDAMQFLGPPVHTVCVGQAASAAAVLLAAGEPGQRSALPNARVLIHQPHGGAQGQSVDMEIAVREMVEMRNRMTDILTERTKQAAGHRRARHGPRLHPAGRRGRGLRRRRPDPQRAQAPPGRRLPQAGRTRKGRRLALSRHTGGMATTLRLRGRDLDLTADRYGPDDGAPVLFFHGGGQTRHAWGGTAELLGDKGWRATTVDLRGHGDSDWSDDGDYDIDAFAGDVRAAARAEPAPPVLIGASLGGLASLVAVAEDPDAATAARPLASGLVLVDVAPRLEPEGIERIAAFMLGHLAGFASLDEVADAVAAYNPHRPRPRNLDGLRKNVRQRDDGRWYWHWDPRFLTGGRIDEPRSFRNENRLDDAARTLTLPTMLVRGQASDVLSEEGAAHLQSLVPHATLVDVADAGHMVAGDRNDVFNDAVVSFLEGAVG